MSDAVRPAAFLSPDELCAPKRSFGAVQRKPEWVLQCELDKFLDRVVLQPRWIQAYDQAHAGQANMNTRMMAIARGCRPGPPEHWVFQGDPLRVVAFECKFGRGRLSDAQQASAATLERLGVKACEVRTIAQALAWLRAAAVRLHGNADNLAVEYQARVDAGLRELALRPKQQRKLRSRSASVASSKKAARSRRRAGAWGAIRMASLP